MNWTGIITAVITTALVNLALYWVLRHARREAPVGGRLVHYGKAMRRFVSLMWVFIGIFLAAVWGGVFPQLAAEGVGAAIFLTFFFAFLVLPLHLEAFGVRIEWDEHNLYTKSPWRPGRVIPWDDVTGHDFSHGMSWHRIYTQRHGISDRTSKRRCAATWRP